jgi:hypothetical protein
MATEGHIVSPLSSAQMIHTIPAADFAHDILATTLQGRSLGRLCSEFNLSSAKTNSTAIEAEISFKIIHLITSSALDHLYNQLCPGYSKKPHAALDHIWRRYEDASCNTIFLSVYNYYTQILATSPSLTDKEILPDSI